MRPTEGHCATWPDPQTGQGVLLQHSKNHHHNNTSDAHTLGSDRLVRRSMSTAVVTTRQYLLRETQFRRALGVHCDDSSTLSQGINMTKLCSHGFFLLGLKGPSSSVKRIKSTQHIEDALCLFNRTVIYQLNNRNYWVVFQAYFEYIGTKSPDSVRPQRHGLFSSVLGVPWQRCYRCIKPEKQTKELCQKWAQQGGTGRWCRLGTEPTCPYIKK